MRTTISSILIALLSVFFLPTVFAQEGVMEEILVTATKRTQTLQEVPLAVSVISEVTMEQSQVNDIIDLQGLVPSLRVSQLQTTGQTNFIIRGFGNGANNPGIEPSVGVFIDGVYRSRSASALSDMPNLERIEVLRGPQSTLFGKNASAGIVKVSTRLPNMNELEGSGTFTYGNYNQIILKGDINGPISDTVGFALSVNSNKRDGYFKNLETGAKLNERDRWGVRGELLFLPSDSVTLRLVADYDEIDEICCGVANLVAGPTYAAIQAVGGQQVSNDAFAYENYFDFDPTNKIENKGISLKADFDFSNDMLLTSITAYREQSRLDNVDVDFTSALALGQNIGDTNIETFTQELRLSQSTESVDWMVGAFYFKEDVQYDNDIRYNVAFRPYADILAMGGITALEQALQSIGQLPPGNPFFAAGQGTAEFSSQKDDTISFFGQADWHATDRITITGGLNYTKVDKTASVNQNNSDIFSSVSMVQVGFGSWFGGLTGLPPTPENIAANPAAAAQAGQLAVTPCSAETGPFCNPTLALQPIQFLPPFVDFPNSVEPGKSKDDKTTWTAVFAFQATDAINLYARAATGFKATSWNLSRDSRPFAEDIPALLMAGLGVPNISAGTRSAGPEDATSYELGFKGQWRSGTMNVAIFDQTIKGFQSNTFVGTGFQLASAGKQSTKGIEIDAMWHPTDQLQLTFAATWLDPKYDSFVEGPAIGGGTVDLSGTTPAGISDFSMTPTAVYYFDIGSVSSFIRGEYIYESEVTVIENVPEDIASRKVSMFNASMGFTWSNGLQLTLWGRNLTNDKFLQSAFPSVAQLGSYGGYPNQPRTYGMSLKASF